MTVSDCVAAHASARPGASAFVTPTQRTSWADYDESATRVAGALLGAGVDRGQRVAVILLHQSQSEIGARRNAGACPNVAILSEDPVAIHRNARIAPRQLTSQLPMRGGSASIEDSGSRQSEGPGAYRSDTARSRRSHPKPSQ